MRLASEIFLRAKSCLQRMDTAKDKFTLYDPCCGGAYLLTTIGIRYGSDLLQLIGSDIDERVLEIAGKNLSLVNIDGLNERIEQIGKMIRDFGKESHVSALESAERLKQQVLQRNSRLTVNSFQADATRIGSLSQLEDVDLVITDVPYGDIVKWEDGSGEPIERLLENLLPVLSPQSVVAIVADKKQTVGSASYKRLEKFKVGKRQVVLLAPG